jgi:hypothetical protein
MNVEVLIAAAALADIATGFYDAHWTDVGIKKGVAVEENTIIKAIFSDKPYFAELCLFNVAQTALFVILTLLAQRGSIYALIGGGIGALFASAGLHIRGAKNWQWLLKGGNPRPKQSAFQKFIGFLSWNEDK